MVYFDLNLIFAWFRIAGRVNSTAPTMNDGLVSRGNSTLNATKGCIAVKFELVGISKKERPNDDDIIFRIASLSDLGATVGNLHDGHIQSSLPLNTLEYYRGVEDPKKRDKFEGVMLVESDRVNAKCLINSSLVSCWTLYDGNEPIEDAIRNSPHYRGEGEEFCLFSSVGQVKAVFQQYVNELSCMPYDRDIGSGRIFPIKGIVFTAYYGKVHYYGSERMPDVNDSRHAIKMIPFSKRDKFRTENEVRFCIVLRSLNEFLNGIQLVYPGVLTEQGDFYINKVFVPRGTLQGCTKKYLKLIKVELVEF